MDMQTYVRYGGWMESSPILQPHELETLRRSLAIGNGLPADQIRRLIETCDTFYTNTDTTYPEKIRSELDALRPVIAELRAWLTTLHELTPLLHKRDSPPTQQFSNSRHPSTGCSNDS